MTTTSFAPPTGAPAGGRIADAVDRYLCSYAYLSPSFARYMSTELVSPSLRAFAPAYGVDFVALARHAEQARRRNVTVYALLLAGFAAAVLLACLGLTPAGSLWVLAAFVMCVAALFALVIWHCVTTNATVAPILDLNVPLRGLAEQLDPQLEARLEEAMSANTVVFAGGHPFVGSGLPLKAWQLNLSLDKPAHDPSGDPRAIRSVSASDLHKELTVAVRSASVPDLDVHNRLFVAGGTAPAIPGLLPDTARRPAASVARATVQRAIEQSRPDGRTYLCVQLTGWRGELVISLYIRAAVMAKHLFVECHAYVLSPLRAEVCAADLLPTRSRSALAAAVVRGIRDTPRYVRSSPRMLLTEAQRDRDRQRLLNQERRAVRQGRLFDYGARTSIRQVVADTERSWLFAYADQEMYLNMLRDRILETIRRFLDDHGVDTAEFQLQRNNISTYNIGSVIGAAVNVGDHGSILTTTSTGQPTPGPSGQTPPTALPWGTGP
jgi:hypothetical protein